MLRLCMRFVESHPISNNMIVSIQVMIFIYYIYKILGCLYAVYHWFDSFSIIYRINHTTNIVNNMIWPSSNISIIILIKYWLIEVFDWVLECLYARISNKEHLYSKKSMLTIKIGLTSPSSSGWGGVLMKHPPPPLFDPYSPRFDPPSPLRYPIPLRYTPIP